MLRLIREETGQLMRRPRTWGFMALLLAGTLLYAIGSKLFGHERTGWQYFDEVSGASVAVMLFSLVMAGNLAGHGGGKVFYIRQTARMKMLLSRYVAAVLYSLALLSTLAAGALLFGGLAFGLSGGGQPYVFDGGAGDAQPIGMALHAFYTYGSEAVSLLMSVTILFMLSSVLKSARWVVILSLAVIVGGNAAVLWFGEANWVKYTLFANDLEQYAKGKPHVPGMTFTYSVSVLVSYFFGLHLVTWLLVSKKQVKRILLYRVGEGKEDQRASS
jgi:ABC-2 type transport system permease protein